MTKPRILYINDFHHGGGAEKVFVDTLHVLGKEFEVTSFAADNRLSGGNLAKSLLFHNSYKQILDKFESFKPDIVHIHNIHNRIGPSVFQAIRTARKKNKAIKVVLTAHDYFFLWANPSFGYYDRSRNLKKLTDLPKISDQLLKKASGKSFVHSLVRKLLWWHIVHWLKAMDDIDLVITPSDFLGDYIRKKFTDKRVVTVRNPCEVPPPEFASEFSKTDNLKIIFLGRLSDEKGLIQLVELIKGLPEMPVRYDIYGDGPLKKTLQEKIDRYHLNEIVFLKGEISRDIKNQIITTYDALILPSIWYENAPLTIVEAAFAGLRILTCNYGGMKELAELSGGEYLFDPFDKESFKKAIRQCLEDRLALKPIKGRDAKNLRDQFSTSTYKEKMITIYYDLFRQQV